MNEIALGVHQIVLTPRNGINAYLLDDVLVDTGMAGSPKKILKALGDKPLRAIALTHAHVDHAGGLDKMVDAKEAPVWVGANDAEAVETGDPVLPKNGFAKVAAFVGSFDGVRVDRRLVEGDELGNGFVVLDVPGHSPGQIAYWRASDRVLVTGDVLTNMNLFTTTVGLHQPPDLVTVDPVRNRESIRAIVALEPDVVCFGHGPVLTDAAPKLKAFLAAMG